MSNLTITNVDTGVVALAHPLSYRDGLLTFAGADTLLAGTILARDSVSLKFVPYVIGGATNQNGIPKAVLTYEVTATGAGDVPIRAFVDGDVRKPRLIVDADGDGDNITEAILDQLRDYGINSVDSDSLSLLDNQ